MPTIHLVRHGEVENPKGVIYGRLPGFHLSERGRRQAEAAGERLSDRDIGVIWASPMERAQETAEAINKYHGLEMVTDERINESSTTVEGVGRTVKALLTDPRHWWHFRNPWKPTWGESFVEIKARMLDAIREATDQADGREIAIVSHQTPVLVARLALAKRRVPPWLAFTPCGTGSITTIVVENGVVREASYFAPSF
jgi:broad specificity phosphatase PhoE